MFSKKEPKAARKNAGAATRTETAPTRKSTMPSIISEGVEIAGDLIGDFEIQVDGTIRGNVKGETITVGKAGLIDGSVEAGKVCVEGRVAGDVRTGDLELGTTARIEGGLVVTGTMSMAAGARVDGTISMSKTVAGTEAKPVDEVAVAPMIAVGGPAE